MRATATALIFGAALVVGCGGDDGAADIVEPTSEATLPGDGWSVEVDILEGVPLPDGTRLAVAELGQFAMYDVEGATFEDVDSFYRATFPAGQDWNDWDWCEQRDELRGSQWVFERRDDLLVVNVMRREYENVMRPNEPAQVSILYDLGPC